MLAICVIQATDNYPTHIETYVNLGKKENIMLKKKLTKNTPTIKRDSTATYENN